MRLPGDVSLRESVCPGGCLPRGCLPRVVSVGGGCFPRVCLSEGVCLGGSAQGNVCLGGCLPRGGVSAWGGSSQGGVHPPVDKILDTRL